MQANGLTRGRRSYASEFESDSLAHAIAQKAPITKTEISVVAAVMLATRH
jgi:hypothetical protein